MLFVTLNSYNDSVMGKPFKGELEKLSDTILWAEKQDVTCLAKFLFKENKDVPL